MSIILSEAQPSFVTPSGSDVIIRPYDEADAEAVQKLFRNGMYSLTNNFVYASILSSLRCPDLTLGVVYMGALGALVGALFVPASFRGKLCLRQTVQIMATATLSVSLTYISLVYYKITTILQKYVEGEIKNDLADIQANYMKPGGTFLVAVLADTNGNHLHHSYNPSDKTKERIIGMVAGSNKGNRELELKRMSVHRKTQSRGLGALLVQALEHFAVTHDYDRISLTTTSPQWAANRLYQKCGYQLSRSVPFPNLTGCFFNQYEKKIGPSSIKC